MLPVNTTETQRVWRWWDTIFALVLIAVVAFILVPLAGGYIKLP